MPESEKAGALFRRNLVENNDRLKGGPPDLGEWDWLICPAWREIRHAFIHFQDWLVVLGCAALLEYCVKDQAYEAQYGLKWDGTERERFFTKTNLGNALRICKEAGVIERILSDQIFYFCRKKRDVISHMNVAAFGKDKVYPSMPEYHKHSDLLIIRENVTAQDNPIASKAAFWEAVNNLSCEMIEETYKIVILLYEDTIKRASRGELGGGAIYTSK